MKLRLLNRIESLRTSYLVVPLLLALAGILLSFALVAVDELLGKQPLTGWGWIYTGGPDGARTMLSTIAGSVITVAGVAYSITIAALALASTQFGPRLLRNFIDDSSNQVVLGVFVSTCLYCLLVLRTIRNASEGAEFVPQIAISTGILLAVLSLVLLVYFIHHVAYSIQAPVVIADVSRDLNRSIDRLFPHGVGNGHPQSREFVVEQEVPADFEVRSQAIPAVINGYLQAIDMETLLREAKSRDAIIKLGFRPGDWILQDTPLVWVYPEDKVDERLEEQVRRSFIRGDFRTPFQDAEFGINQLVEIAVRALSPAINDPFTAMTALDHLGAALIHVLKQGIPSPYRYDEGDKLRLIAERISFRGMTNASFNMIRQYGRDSAAVTIRLLETLAHIAPHARTDEDREVIWQHAQMTRRDCQPVLADNEDRDDVEERFQSVCRLLNRSA